MQAKPRDAQGELYSVRLDFLRSETHLFVRLANVIDWSQFDQTFGKLYCEGLGRPAKPTRLMAGDAACPDNQRWLEDEGIEANEPSAFERGHDSPGESGELSDRRKAVSSHAGQTGEGGQSRRRCASPVLHAQIETVFSDTKPLCAFTSQ